MGQQNTRKRQNRQYSATTRTLKGRVSGVGRLRNLSQQLSTDLPALQMLHLSSIVLFQKYANHANGVFYSQLLRALAKKIQAKNKSRTIVKNIEKDVARLCRMGFLPDPLGMIDPVMKHTSVSVAGIVARLVNRGTIDFKDEERELLFSHFKLLRETLRTPERHFAMAVKALRSQTRMAKNLIGAEKADSVLKEIWRQSGYDWALIRADAYDEMQNKIEGAFKNEK